MSLCGAWWSTLTWQKAREDEQHQQPIHVRLLTSNMTALPPTQVPILAIVVVGKHGQPLYLRNFTAAQGGEADLKWHYAAHTSLDVFDERGRRGAASSALGKLK